MLQAYLKVDSMNAVKPAVLLTLWYVTGEKSYSQQITKLYPKSIEASIVRGDAQLLPTPFWFFVPKSGEAEQGTGSFSMPEEPKPTAAQTAAAEKPVKFTKNFNLTEITGRGGTNFQPPIDYFLENRSRYSGMIIFTDGEGDVPKISGAVGNSAILWILDSRLAYEKSRWWIESLPGNIGTFLP